MNLIEKTIEENIHKLNAVFVFPTQTSADMWADRATQITDVSAVAMERFLAWDDFKGQSVKSRQTDRMSIPSAMRQIFAVQVLEENAKEPFFKSIIPAQYAKSASNFADWISGILPGLLIWKQYYDNLKKAPDEEDADLLKLFDLYKQFLDNYKLFDPAWEKPPFQKDGNHYFIFFPEILSDYIEYKSLLENSAEDITLIHLPEERASESLPKVQFYNNSRSELKAIALQLRQLHDEKEISWDEIAVSIPDLDSYGVYLDRELELYEIPHVIRASKTLAATGSGTFFLQLQNCVTKDFTFDSLKTLLFNMELPWKNLELSKELIAFGQSNNCICNFVYNNKKNDIWLKSFADNYNVNPELKPYYQTIRSLAENIVNADSFDKIRSAYFAFRTKFFDMDNCPLQTDRLISRCISELSGLIDLEEDFPECKIANPYKFFVNKLNSTQYLEQTDKRGVQILPYKMAATAPFACHVILDASQNSSSVIYKELSFLREDKRRLLLKTEDPNVSDFFIRLYSMNSYKQPALFTCAAKTFSGYSQPTSYLEEENFIKESPSYFAEDLYQAEKKALLEGVKPLSKVTEIEKEGFDFWKKSQSYNQNEAASEDIKALINQKVKELRFKEDYLKVSATHLNNFCKCERFYILNSVLILKELDNEASLMDQFARGTLKHKVLELYLNQLKEEMQPLCLKEGDLPDGHDAIIRACIKEAINEKGYGRKQYSYLSRELLNTTEEAFFVEIKKTILAFAGHFEGCSVYGTEVHLKYEYEEKKLLLDGYIDCLLQNPEDGDFILVDFKSTANAIPAIKTEEELSKNPKVKYPDFQMPMYLYLLKHQEKKYPVDKCLFFNIKDAKPVEINLELFQPVMDRFEAALDDYSASLLNQAYVKEPHKDFSECNACNYRALCRKIFTVGRSL